MLLRKKNDLVKEFVGVLFIILMCFFTKTNYHSPIYADEMGYLSNAALMTGLDWSNAVQNLPYYGYGVAILYVPLFWLFDSVDLIYVGVKVINTLLLVGMYYVAKKTLVNIYGEENCVQCTIVASLCCCTSYLLTARNFALSEVPLAMLYFSSVLFFTKYMKTNKQIWKIMLLVIDTYMLMIHVRTIGCFAVTVFMLSCYDFKATEGGRRLKNWAITIVIAVIGIGLCFGIKEIFISIGGTGSVSTINDISGQSVKISYLFSKDGLLAFLISICSKLWSFGIAYFLLAFVGFIFALMYIFEDKNRFLMAFLVLAFGAEFAINCAYISYIDRTDMIFYTRYSEFAILPFFCMGLIEILNNKCKPATIISVLLLEVGLTGAVIYAENAYECSRYLAACIPAMMFWWEDSYINYKLALIIIILIAIGLYLLKDKSKYIVLVVILAIWIMSSSISYTEYEETLSVDVLYGCREAAQYVQDNGYEKVYVVGDATWDGMHNPCWIQYFLPTMEVEIIDVSEIDLCVLEEGEVILSSRKIYQDNNLDLSYVHETDRFYFVENK